MTINVHTGFSMEPSSKTLPQLMKALESSGLEASPSAVRMVGDALSLNEALPGLVRHEATAILLDINNLYRRSADNGWKIDYNLLKSTFDQRCDLRYCAAFSAVDRGDPRGVKWASYMMEKGYAMICKDLKRYTNSQGVVVSKGNMDIDITIEALSLSSAFTHVIIGTCDGDFVPLIHKLKEGHCRKVSVLGISNENWTGMSETLIHAADFFYDMSSFKEHIMYRKEKP